jgi:putative Holliday junction resolvase
MRIVAIDLGERRIGVAAADDRTRVALPVRTVEVKGDPVDEIVKIADEERAEELVIGLPLSISGAEGPQALLVRETIERLEAVTSIPIRTHDERFTTTEAVKTIAATGSKKKPRGRDNRDAIAASILLQSYLDSGKPYG